MVTAVRQICGHSSETEKNIFSSRWRILANQVLAYRVRERNKKNATLEVRTTTKITNEWKQRNSEMRQHTNYTRRKSTYCQIRTWWTYAVVANACCCTKEHEQDKTYRHLIRENIIKVGKAHFFKSQKSYSRRPYHINSNKYLYRLKT